MICLNTSVASVRTTPGTQVAEFQVQGSDLLSCDSLVAWKDRTGISERSQGSSTKQGLESTAAAFPWKHGGVVLS